VWRIGRKAYCYARRELSNLPEENGEYWLLTKFAQLAEDAGSILVDIGANVGNWSETAARALSSQSKRCKALYAFEPARSTFVHLQDRLTRFTFAETLNAAVSDASGVVNFFGMGDLAGTSSLYEMPGSAQETVNALTLDQFAIDRGIERISFVKSDTEGHEMHVLRGASKLLSCGEIDVWQFEYNHRWVFSRSYLRDVFEFVTDKPYSVGRLTPASINTFKQWHPELERYFETNYVLIRKGSAYESLCVPHAFNNSNVAVPA
jgi:FkbM family methyltransferase